MKKIKSLNSLFASCSSITVCSYLLTYILMFIYLLAPLLNNEIFSNILLIFISFILQYIIMFMVYKIFYNDYDIKKDFSMFNIKAIISIGLVLLITICLSTLIVLIFNLFHIPLTQTVDLVDYPSYIMFPFAVIIGPIIEELFFRGVLFDSLKKNDIYFGVLFSSLAFGMFHGTLIQIPAAFIMGMLLCFLKIKYNSIIPCIICHILNNLMEMLNISIEFNNIVLIIIGIVMLIIMIRYREILKNILNAFKDNINILIKSSWFYVFLIITIILVVLSLI